MNLFSALRALHLLAMGIWFGVGIFWPGDVRRTLARGAPHTDALAERIARALSVATISGFLTIGTGFGMVLLMGGMKALPIRMHVGLGLTLMLVALDLALVSPTVARIGRALADGQPDEARAAAKRLGPLVGIEHTLKLAAFVTMIVRV